jgi:hypothetical protein
MTTLFNYVPESVQCLIAGFIPIEGYVDGTFISVDKDEMPYSSVRMPDGTIARKYNNSQTYTITITLHNGAETNNLLTKMWQVDEITQRGKFPLLIKDQSGSDLLFSTESWIEGIPSLTKSNAIDSRVWVIKSAYAVINIGGNEEVSSLLNDITNIAVSALPGLSLF